MLHSGSDVARTLGEDDSAVFDAAAALRHDGGLLCQFRMVRGAVLLERDDSLPRYDGGLARGQAACQDRGCPSPYPAGGGCSDA